MINIVGAVSLQATLNCEAFADAHQATSHFDKASFVGLAWRPADEHCCCEIYTTGRANLPGAKTERHLLASFYRMLPELLRFSSASWLLQHIPKADREFHVRDTRHQTAASSASAHAAVGQESALADALSAEDAEDAEDAVAARELVDALGL